MGLYNGYNTFEICDDGHDQIVYTGRKCPLCEAIKTSEDLTDSLKDLEEKFDELKEKYDDLYDNIESNYPEALL